MSELLTSLTPDEQFSSRTLHCGLGLSIKNRDHFTKESVISLLEGILSLDDKKTSLVMMDLGAHKSANKKNMRMMYKQINEAFNTCWAVDDNSNYGILCAVMSVFSDVDKRKIYKGIYIAPNSHINSNHQVIDSLFLKNNPWLVKASTSRRHTNILTTIINICFRRFIYNLPNSSSKDVEGHVFYDSLLSIVSIYKNTYSGYSLKINLNYFGTAELSVQRTKIILNDDFEFWNQSSDGLNHVRRGNFSLADARTKSPESHIRFPSRNKIVNSGNALSLEEKQKTLKTEIIRQNDYYDIFLDFLEQSHLKVVPVRFRPSHYAATPLSQIKTKNKKFAFKEDIEKFKQQTKSINVLFSDISEQSVRVAHLNKLSEMLDDQGFQSTKLNIIETLGESPKDPVIVINKTYDYDGDKTSFYQVIDGKVVTHSTLNSLLMSKESNSPFDPFTEIKLNLYKSKRHDWQQLQGLNDNNCDNTDAFNKISTELYLKNKLFNCPSSFPVALPVNENGYYAGIYSLNPKGLPPRASLLLFSLNSDGIHLQDWSIFTCTNVNDHPKKAVRRLIQESGCNILNEKMLSSLINTDHLWFNDSFVMVSLDDYQVLKTTSSTAYCPRMIGDFPRHMNKSDLFELDSDSEINHKDGKRNALVFNRVQQGSTQKRKTPKRSLVPHMFPSKTNAIYVEDCKQYLRVHPGVFNVNSNVECGFRLRDVSVYKVEENVLILDANQMHSSVFSAYLQTLVGDLIRSKGVSRTTLIEKLCQIAVSN